jgi:hypothetical protein
VPASFPDELGDAVALDPLAVDPLEPPQAVSATSAAATRTTWRERVTGRPR